MHINGSIRPSSRHPVRAAVAAVGGVAVAGVAIAAAVRRQRQQFQGEEQITFNDEAIIDGESREWTAIDDYITSRYKREIRIQSSMEEEDEEEKKNVGKKHSAAATQRLRFLYSACVCTAAKTYFCRMRMYRDIFLPLCIRMRMH